MSKRSQIIYWVATVWMALGMVVTPIGSFFLNREGFSGFYLSEETADSVA